MPRGQDTSRNPERNLGTTSANPIQARLAAEQAHNRHLFGGDLENAHVRSWKAADRVLNAIDQRYRSLGSLMQDDIRNTSAEGMVDIGMRDRAPSGPVTSRVDLSIVRPEAVLSDEGYEALKNHLK